MITSSVCPASGVRESVHSQSRPSILSKKRIKPAARNFFDDFNLVLSSSSLLLAATRPKQPEPNPPILAAPKKTVHFHKSEVRQDKIVAWRPVVPLKIPTKSESSPRSPIPTASPVSQLNLKPAKR